MAGGGGSWVPGQSKGLPVPSGTLSWVGPRPLPADAWWFLQPLLRLGRWCTSTRKLSTALAPGPSDLNYDMERAVYDADAAFRIHMVLHDLEEPYKEVFQLRVFGELSFAQIASIFRKTESWARVTYHRARLKIQERMD